MNYLQQAYKGRTTWWRWLIILLVFLHPYVRKLVATYLIAPLSLILPNSKNIALGLNFAVYIVLLAFFIVLFKLLHKRDFFTLISVRKKFDWIRFTLSFSSWGLVTIFMMTVPVFFDYGNFTWNFKLIPFIELLIVCLIIMPFDILFKEVLYRGYLLQYVTFLFKKPWLSLLIITLVYAFIMHIANEKLFTLVGGGIIVYYLLINFLLGAIIILDDGIEVVIGMKMANNLIYILFTTSKVYDVQRDSVLVSESGGSVINIVYLSLLFYPLYFLFLKRVYKWNNWKEKIFGKH